MAADTEIRIMVVDDEIRWAQGLEESYRGAHVDFRPKAWLRDTRETTLKRIRPDAVLWDCTKPDEETADLVHYLHRLEPSLPMLLVVDFKQSPLPQRFAGIEAIDLVRAPADIEEVVYRMRRLMREAKRSLSLPSTKKKGAAKEAEPDSRQSPASHPVFPHMALDIYDAQSGRLDARKISVLFGIKLSEMAGLLNQKMSTLSKTADAPSVQSGLALFQHIGLALSRLVGSSEGLRIWMNVPNPQLEGKTPLAVVLERQGEVVAEMLDDLLTGQPA